MQDYWLLFWLQTALLEICKVILSEAEEKKLDICFLSLSHTFVSIYTRALVYVASKLPEHLLELNFTLNNSNYTQRGTDMQKNTLQLNVSGTELGRLHALAIVFAMQANLTYFQPTTHFTLFQGRILAQNSMSWYFFHPLIS